MPRLVVPEYNNEPNGVVVCQEPCATSYLKPEVKKDSARNGTGEENSEKILEKCAKPCT